MCPRKPKRTLGHLGICGSCKPLNVAAEKQTVAHWKSTNHSLIDETSAQPHNKHFLNRTINGPTINWKINKIRFK